VRHRPALRRSPLAGNEVVPARFASPVPSAIVHSERHTVRTKKTTLSRLSKALLEMAEDQHSAGLMDDDSYRKIIVRHLGADAPNTSRKKIRKPASQRA
jgi:hypothetical protein